MSEKNKIPVCTIIIRLWVAFTSVAGVLLGAFLFEGDIIISSDWKLCILVVSNVVCISACIISAAEGAARKQNA